MIQEIINLAAQKRIDINASLYCLFDATIYPDNDRKSLETLPAEQQQAFLALVTVIDPRANISSGTLDEYYAELNMVDDFQTWCCKRFVNHNIQSRTFYLLRKSATNSQVILLASGPSAHQLERHQSLLQPIVTQLTKRFDLQQIQSTAVSSTQSSSASSSNEDAPPPIIDLNALAPSPKKRAAELLQAAVYYSETPDKWAQCIELFALSLSESHNLFYLEKIEKQFCLIVTSHNSERRVTFPINGVEKISDFVEQFCQALSKHAGEQVNDFILLSISVSPKTLFQYSLEHPLSKTNLVNRQWIQLCLRMVLQSEQDIFLFFKKILSEKIPTTGMSHEINALFNRCVAFNLIETKSLDHVFWSWLTQVHQQIDIWNIAHLVRHMTAKENLFDKIEWLIERSWPIADELLFMSVVAWLEQNTAVITKQQTKKIVVYLEHRLKDIILQGKEFSILEIIKLKHIFLRDAGLQEAVMRKIIESETITPIPVQKTVSSSSKGRKKNQEISHHPQLQAPYKVNMSFTVALEHFRQELKESMNTLLNQIALLNRQGGRGVYTEIYSLKARNAKPAVESFYHYLHYKCTTHVLEHKITAADKTLLATQMFAPLFNMASKENSDTLFYFLCICQYLPGINLLLSLLPAGILAKQSSYPLTDCIQLHLISVLKTLLQHGMDPNKPCCPEGILPLQIAISAHDGDQTIDRSPIINLLLDHGADTEIRADLEKCYHGYVKGKVTILLECIILFCHKPSEKRLEKYIDLLIERGADVTASFYDPRGFTINGLDIAVSYQCGKLEKKLLHLGVGFCLGILPREAEFFPDNPMQNKEENKVYKQLDEAHQQNIDFAAFRKLLFNIEAAGYNLSAFGVLPYCIKKGYQRLALYLAEHVELDLSRQYELDGTPLIAAVLAKEVNIARILLSKELNIDQKFIAEGKLMTAYVPKHMVQFVDLIPPKLLIKELKYDGHTALHIAVLQDDEPMLQLLLEHGASTKCTNDENKTATQLAAQNKNINLVKLLVAACQKSQTPASNVFKVS